MDLSTQISLGRIFRLSNRASWGNLTLLGLDVFALLMGNNIGNRIAWLGAFSIVCCSGLAAWAGNTRRQRLIYDVPTSRIASAAQGYAELSGHIEQHGDEMLLAKLSQTPCAWYRYQIEEKDADDDWRVTEYGDSDQTFLLLDETGACVIDPVGAEITTAHKNVWTEFDNRHTEYLLLPGDELYALGEFSTIGPDTSQQTFKREVAELLSAWKADRADLLQRFDTNRDGEVDLPEWEIARAAAEAEIRAQHSQRATEKPVHLLSKPQMNRPFLISNLGHDHLSQRYRRWAWGHLAIFFAGCGGLAYSLLLA